MLKIGIVGSGFGLYGLLPAFHSLSGCRVVAICGKRTERLTKYCASIGLEHIYQDWGQMLADEQLDALAIAVVPSAQYEIAKTAIRAGLHVFAEKPLAASVRQARELSLLARKYKVVTAVDFLFPEIEAWKAVKKLLDRRAVGRLRCISASWHFQSYDIKNGIASWKTDPTQGGGALAGYCSHFLYNLEFFGGEISHIRSQLSHSKASLGGGEVGVDALLTFKNGIQGIMHFNCNTPGLHEHRYEFLCERGCIILENQDSITREFKVTVTAPGSVRQTPVRDTEPANSKEDERVRVVRKLARRFVASCRKRRSMTPSFKEGFRVQELVEAVRSAQEGELRNKLQPFHS